MGPGGYRSRLRGGGPRALAAASELFEPQCEQGARVDCPPGVLFERARDRGGVDDRVAPVVKCDPFWEEFGAERVAVAGDRIHAELGAHTAVRS